MIIMIIIDECFCDTKIRNWQIFVIKNTKLADIADSEMCLKVYCDQICINSMFSVSCKLPLRGQSGEI